MLLNLSWFYRDLGVRLGLSPSFLPHVPDPCSRGTRRWRHSWQLAAGCKACGWEGLTLYVCCTVGYLFFQACVCFKHYSFSL